ncbi:hypothetical protein CEXT_610631 [Caerostris extrusa]|uniref:TonB C-terminal domain-containing protein n=1 Tax=Caerostris extrusa TaxID=172846 RepID=A0AAV4RP55_CAEEX|nr:hypothetical protein CEXT_610631 [Caerostris extrusa]
MPSGNFPGYRHTGKQSTLNLPFEFQFSSTAFSDAADEACLRETSRDIAMLLRKHAFGKLPGYRYKGKQFTLNLPFEFQF